MGSRDLRKIACGHCHKIFWRSERQVKENRRLGHQSFCSLKCLSQNKIKGRYFFCENVSCKKEFFRAPHDISPHNYCSQSCAAIINNIKFPKWPFKVCKHCKKKYHGEGRIYCSVSCRLMARRPYTRESLIESIRKLVKELGRIPAKREDRILTERAVHTFGTWNKAVFAAGFEPNRSHDDRMYKRSKTRAVDGHICDSISEALVDNWLHEHQIAHEREVTYPTSGHRADWTIRGGTVFVEYFGLSKDSPRYDRAVKIKKQLCKKANIFLIELYPQDLYPKLNLDAKFNKIVG